MKTSGTDEEVKAEDITYTNQRFRFSTVLVYLVLCIGC